MKITDREEEILNYFWKNGKSFIKDIVASHNDPKPHYNTISTLVRNLEEKNLVGHEKYGTTYMYFPLISKEEYVKKNLDEEVKKYFNNSYKSLISSLVDSKDITIEEIKELIELANKSNKK